MSLRDFNAPFPSDPHALHNEPLGNSTGLKSFHTTQPQDREPNNMPKIIGAAVVALMVGTAGVVLYTSSGSQPKPVVTASNQAASAPEAPAASMAMDANTPATPPAATDTSSQSAPVKTADTPAPVKAASTPKPKKHVAATPDQSAGSAAATRMAADSSLSTIQPQQQQAVTAPAAPSPSPSDVATNNTQSGVAVAPNATQAADMPAAQPQQQAQQPAAPAEAPAQAAGQVNQ